MRAPEGRGLVGGAMRKIQVAEGDVERKMFVFYRSADYACQVVVPFYTACGECFYCVRGQASRCSKGTSPTFPAPLPISITD